MAVGTAVFPSSLTFAGSACRVPLGNFKSPVVLKASCSSEQPLVSRTVSVLRRQTQCQAVSSSLQRNWSSSGSAKLYVEAPVSPGKRRLHNHGRRGNLVVVGAVVANDGVRWWEREGIPNMKDLHSTQEFVEALASANDRLVVVEFYATWCGSCRALFPKLCKIAEQNQDIYFYKVNFDENKAMCKSLNIKVLPFFHFYRGSAGRLDAFSASISKLQRLKDALATHSTDRCSLGPPPGVEGLNLFVDSPASSSSPDVSTAAGAL